MELILMGHIIASYLAELIKIEPHNLEMTDLSGNIIFPLKIAAPEYYAVLRRKMMALGCLFLERRESCIAPLREPLGQHISTRHPRLVSKHQNKADADQSYQDDLKAEKFGSLEF